MDTKYSTSFITPIGKIYLEATQRGVCRVSLGNAHPSHPQKRESRRTPAYFKNIKKDILKFLSGKPVSFKKYALDMEGTGFQKKVWRELLSISHGCVLTYKEVAQKVGARCAFRAVGNACGKNKLPLIIPCHRVIAGNGRLGGFSSGLKLKRQLLNLEGVKLK